MIYDGNTIEQKRQKLLKKEGLLIRWDYHNNTWEQYVNHIESLRPARIKEIYEAMTKMSMMHHDDWGDCWLEWDVFYDLEGSPDFDKDRLLTPDERGEIEKYIEYMAEYVLNQDETLNFEGMSDDELLQYEADMKEAWDDKISKHREG